MIDARTHIEPQRVDTGTTQIDIAPTVLGRVGLVYPAPCFGQYAFSTPLVVIDDFQAANEFVAVHRYEPADALRPPSLPARHVEGR